MKRIILISFSFLTLLLVISQCEKLGGKKVNCTAGCTEMSWEIEGETGEEGVETQQTCTRDYDNFGNYTETCVGTKKFINSGNTYSYTAVFNWIECSITVDVEDLGSCSENAGSKKSQGNCDFGSPGTFVQHKTNL